MMQFSNLLNEPSPPTYLIDQSYLMSREAMFLNSSCGATHSGSSNGLEEHPALSLSDLELYLCWLTTTITTSLLHSRELLFFDNI
jgi:hypothetical protein